MNFYDVIETPLGEWLTAVDEVGELLAVELWLPGSDPLASSRGHVRRMGATRDPGRLVHVGEQLGQYSAGERHEFDLTLAAQGSDFQRRVWAGLQRIPYGTTCSYGELAEAIGLDRRTSSRAVGLANGANPVSVVVPCHRVIGANGKLVGYAGGLEMKRRLLEHEGALAPMLL
jgi:methylated-DNA-[protein]-cysteine S-methyltransferase